MRDRNDFAFVGDLLFVTALILLIIWLFGDK
jgi:hypothetical protein